MVHSEQQLNPHAITHAQPSARGLIQDEAGRVLLVYERDGEIWTLPGGRIDYQEKAMEAVVREVFEETGIKTVVENFAFALEHYIKRIDWHIVHLVFQMKSISSKEVNDNWEDHDLEDVSGGVAQAQFFSLDEMKAMDNIEPSCLIEYLQQGEKALFASYM